MLALALGSVPMAMLTLPLVINIPEFFGNALGLNLTIIGIIFMAVRVFDIVVDPFLGVLMDRTRTRFGRFKPWIAVGVPLLVAGTLMLFMAQEGVGPLYLAAGLILAYLGWSTFSLAQLSLASALAKKYSDRARVYGWIQAAFFLGTCLVMLMPLFLGGAGSDPAASLRAMGLLIVATTIPVAILMWLLVPEPDDGGQTHRLPIRDYVRLVTRPAVGRLLILDLALGLGFGISSAVLLFYFTAVKDLDRSVLGILLIAQMGAGMLSMPLLAGLAARIGKQVALALCAVGTIITCPTMILVPSGSLTGAATVMAVWGVFYGGIVFLPRAMMADAGDEARRDGHPDRTGVLYALLISSWKLGGALSVGLSFLALDWIGYRAPLGAGNSRDAIVGLEVLFALSPALMGVIGAVIAWRYPLTRERHAAIRAALDARRAEEADENLPAAAAAPVAA
ncbi:MAG: MFS transporter [Allosphingosinicella sp.]|uniref:MFS transporter n=1 Tax=Allosphingosinicella sp. TaxID=2823234 RepID=UPI003944EC2F